MTDKKPYSDPRWHEPLKPVIVDSSLVTDEERKRNEEFRKEVQEMIKDGRIQLKQKK